MLEEGLNDDGTEPETGMGSERVGHKESWVSSVLHSRVSGCRATLMT